MQETAQRDSAALRQIKGGGGLLHSFQSAPALCKLSREIESALQPQRKKYRSILGREN